MSTSTLESPSNPSFRGRTSSTSSAARLQVSVVIPAYKAAATIRRAIDSVLAQTSRADEIIVVDDDSPEDHGPVLESYGSKVTYIRQPRGGAAAARNRGIAAATGDLIAFLDADDEWTPTKLAECQAVFARHPGVGVVASRYVLRDDCGLPDETAGPKPEWCGRPVKVAGGELLDFAKATSTPTVVARREWLAGDRFDTTLTTAEDRDLWVRLLCRGDAYFIESPQCIVHVRSDSLSNGNVDVDCRCMLRVIERYQSRIGRLNAFREKSYVHYRWSLGLPAGWQALKHWALSALLWPLPYSSRRVRSRLARPRALLSIVRRAVG